VAGAHGADRGLDDVGRRVEAGLADLEVHDLAAGRLKRSRAGEDLEGRFGSQARHARRELDGLHGP
jgi:hypothetical protein